MQIASFLDRSPWKISLRLVNLWYDSDTVSHWRLNLSLMLLIIVWTGFDHRLACLMQKQVVLCLFCWLLESSLACLYALASSLSCNCLVSIGIFLVRRPACCAVKLGSVVGRFCLVVGFCSFQ